MTQNTAVPMQCGAASAMLALFIIFSAWSFIFTFACSVQQCMVTKRSIAGQGICHCGISRFLHNLVGLPSTRIHSFC